MTGGLKKQVHPGVAAVLILGVLVAVLWSWYKGLIYQKPPPRATAGGPGAAMPPRFTTILGRQDIQVETLAGDMDPGYADGPGHAARFDRPTGLAVAPDGTIYVADSGNHRIRKIAPGGETATVAGAGIGYADGPATQAKFNAPSGVALGTDGTLFVADTGNNAIRVIRNGQVTTLKKLPDNAAGRPDGPVSPIALAMSPGRVPTILSAEARPQGITVYDLAGNLSGYIKIPGVATAVSASAGTAAAIPQQSTLILGASTLTKVPIEGTNEEPLKLHRPVGIWPLGEDWLVTDANHAAVFLVSNGTASVLAGSATAGPRISGSRDADGSRASFSVLSGVVAQDQNHIVVADTGNNMIRRLTVYQSRPSSNRSPFDEESGVQP